MAKRSKRGGTPAPSPSSSAPPPRLLFWRSGPDARSRAQEELEALQPNERAELLIVLRRIRDGQQRGNDIKPLGDKILEARARTGEAFLRAAYFRWGSDFVCLTVFKKKKNQTEPQDLARAQQRRSAWLHTFGDTPGPARDPSSG